MTAIPVLLESLATPSEGTLGPLGGTMPAIRELEVEISSEGGVALVGSAKAGASGS